MSKHRLGQQYKVPPPCTAGELHAVLASMIRADPKAADQPIILSRDGEGNGFSPLHQVSPARYEADSAWSGEIVEEGGTEALVLWPMN